MIKLKTGNGEWLCVKVPTALDYRMSGNILECLQGRLVWAWNEPSHEEHWVDEIPLPDGNYSILGIAKDLTEEQCENIVDVGAQEGGYKAFVDYNYDNGYHYTASGSFRSLLAANGVDVNSLILRIK